MSVLRRGQDATQPTWFSLNKYRAQKDLDLAGWLLQIGIRRDLLIYLTQEEGEEEGPTSKEGGLAEEILEWIYDDPILAKDRLASRFTRSQGRILFPNFTVLFDTQPRNHMGVHATTVEELHRFPLDIDHKVQNQTTTFFDQVLRSISDEPDSGISLEDIDHRLLEYKEIPLRTSLEWLTLFIALQKRFDAISSLP